MNSIYSDTPAGRLRLLLEARHRGETARQWAARYNIPEGTLYGWLNGNRAIQVRTAEMLARALNASAAWILTGEEQTSLAEEESWIVDAYRQADETTREIVRRILAPHGRQPD